jgi:RES domain-containing protein
MTPLPAALGDSGLVAWRLVRDRHLADWESAEGAFLVGGRWSSAGRRVLYTSLDPATTILEVAVHTGFEVLDQLPHTLLALDVDPAGVEVLWPAEIPDPSWLRPGMVRPGQQTYGDALLDRHPLAVVPSVVSTRSWSLLIDAPNARGLFALKEREPFMLDPRLAAGREARSPGGSIGLCTHLAGASSLRASGRPGSGSGASRPA